jgi:hypothetical protein
MISSPHQRAILGSHLARGAAAGAVTEVCMITFTARSGGSSGGASDLQVASLPDTTAASGSSQQSGGQPAATANSAGRPQMRLDDTSQQREAYIQAWDACLVAHGAHYDTTQGKSAYNVAEPIPAAASAACIDELPLMPPPTREGCGCTGSRSWLPTCCPTCVLRTRYRPRPRASRSPRPPRRTRPIRRSGAVAPSGREPRHQRSATHSGRRPRAPGRQPRRRCRSHRCRGYRHRHQR